MSETMNELESQFILRLPTEAARTLRKAIRTESSLKDRFTIKIEKDMRHSEVRVDNWVMQGKIVDLPTIVESLKTTDSKGFCKTADICQMLICKEEDAQDEDAPQKVKKPEKKYLWPHGIAPSLKNVRKQRFRKTLRKKNAEDLDIEKEVQRLLSADNDAVSVRWEFVEEDLPLVKEESVQENLDEQYLFGARISDSDEDDAVLNVFDSEDLFPVIPGL